MSAIPEDQQPDPVECPDCGAMAGWVDWVVEDIQTAFGPRGVPSGDKFRCAECGNVVREVW